MTGLNKLRIGFLSTIYHTSFILMCNKWVEKELGLESYWELHGTGPSIIKQFLENKLDIGYIGLPPTIIGIDKGAKVKCVAGGHVDGTVIVVPDHFKSYSDLNNDPFTVFKQFQDKTIAVPKQGSIHDVILRYWIKRAGIETRVQIQNYEIADFILIDLQEKKIDAACGTPALAAYLGEHLNTKLALPPAVLWPYNPSYGIVVSENLIENRPDVVEGFIQLHKKACQMLRETPREAAQLVERELELIKENFILETFKISPKYCAALPPEFVESTLKFGTVLQELGYVERELHETEIFDFSFIKKLHPEPHHYDSGIHL